jgi:hypothetical protein
MTRWVESLRPDSPARARWPRLRCGIALPAGRERLGASATTSERESYNSRIWLRSVIVTLPRASDEQTRKQGGDNAHCIGEDALADAVADIVKLIRYSISAISTCLLESRLRTSHIRVGIALSMPRASRTS